MGIFKRASIVKEGVTHLSAFWRKSKHNKLSLITCLDVLGLGVITLFQLKYPKTSHPNNLTFKVSKNILTYLNLLKTKPNYSPINLHNWISKATISEIYLKMLEISKLLFQVFEVSRLK